MKIQQAVNLTMQSPHFQRIHQHAPLLVQSPSTGEDNLHIEEHKLAQWTDEPALAVFWFVYFVVIAYAARIWLQMG